METEAVPINQRKLTYSVPEAARLIGISVPNMYVLARSAGFPTVHIGKRLLIPCKALEQWLENQIA